MSNRLPHIQLPVVQQQSENHCGPATLQMLFSYINKTFSQNEIVNAALAEQTIEEAGTRPFQLAKAVKKLLPHHQFWFKQHATVGDIYTLIHKYNYPVAVNWQGFFYDKVEDENPKGVRDEEYGHYSVVIDIDPIKDTITIADPYKDFYLTPREFSLKWFEKRWKDSVDDYDKRKGMKYMTQTKEFIFIIVPKSATFPKKLGMQLPSKLKTITTKKPMTLFEKLFVRTPKVVPIP